LAAVVFFFSSRRRHTRFSRDWSSDVCSSDLNQNDHLLVVQWVEASTHPDAPHVQPVNGHFGYGYQWWIPESKQGEFMAMGVYGRSEERRVGKECRSRGARTQ